SPPSSLAPRGPMLVPVGRVRARARLRVPVLPLRARRAAQRPRETAPAGGTRRAPVPSVGDRRGMATSEEAGDEAPVRVRGDEPRRALTAGELEELQEEVSRTYGAFGVRAEDGEDEGLHAAGDRNGWRSP